MNKKSLLKELKGLAAKWDRESRVALKQAKKPDQPEEWHKGRAYESNRCLDDLLLVIDMAKTL